VDAIGLSYESAILAGGHYFAPNNTSALGLIRSLGKSGVIRIGGNASERTVWGADVKPEEFASVLTPAGYRWVGRCPARAGMEAHLWIKPRARLAGGRS
jgi:hypothetical protein